MRLYLSQLILSPRSRQVQAELRDPYQMHRTLSKAFGDEQGAWEAARVLFRVDEVDSRPSVIVQSKTPPDWSSLTVSDDYLAEAPLMKELSPSLSPRQTLAFRLLSNPTVKRDGKRWGLLSEQEQLDWLKRKANNHGFRILSAGTLSQGKLRSRTAEGRETTFMAVRFDGVLEVIDADALVSALENGIGSAKGVGFGLLSVAPIRR